jgi:hypothetical protein
MAQWERMMFTKVQLHRMGALMEDEFADVPDATMMIVEQTNLHGGATVMVRCGGAQPETLDEVLVSPTGQTALFNEAAWQ